MSVSSRLQLGHLALRGDVPDARGGVARRGGDLRAVGAPRAREPGAYTRPHLYLNVSTSSKWHNLLVGVSLSVTKTAEAGLRSGRV